MSRLDIVIFGATGFTGKKVVEEAVRLAPKYGLSWGIAGRSQSKLESLLADIGKKTGQDLSAVKVIVAEVTDEPSLKAMCQQARVVANCCGPYRLYGEPVVRAAVENNADYVDVSGEPQFIETMQLKYDEAARERGVFVVSACGFDSVPNDMGVVYMQQHFDGTLNSVESYVSCSVAAALSGDIARRGVVNYGTWDSLVRSVAARGELAPLRKQLYPERLPALRPKLQPRPILHKHEGKWCLPFPGADGSVLYRTQRGRHARGQRPVQFKPYVQFPALLTALLTALVGALLLLLGSWSWSRQLLLRFPRVFSLGAVSAEGPTEAVTEGTSFAFQLRGRGWARDQDVEKDKPEKTITVLVKGVNPGYGATVTALMFCAITVLKERHNMPGKGGVLTTGMAFEKTDLIKNLNENNLTFEVVENK